MLSDADAFLDAIWANPDDDTPRLIYADWLEEHGYADYARSIRLSCQLAREVLPPDERKALRHERYVLGQAIAKARFHAFGNQGRYLYSDGYGIPHDFMAVDTDIFLRDWPHWWPFFHPRKLRLYDADGYETALSDCRYLVRIDSLWCEGRVIGTDFLNGREAIRRQPIAGSILRGLAASRAIDRLSALAVEPIAVTLDELTTFADSELAARLEELRLWVQFTDGTDEELRPLSGYIREEITDFIAANRHRLPT